MITLEKISMENIWKVIKLSVTEEQDDFVASNNESLLEAYVTISEGNIALPFALKSDDTLIGFVMIGYGTTGDESEPDIAEGNYCLWRFMIDKDFQGQGYGRAALAASLEYIKTLPCGPAEYCWLSYEPENNVAKSLYASFGFVETGELCEDELIAVLKL